MTYILLLLCMHCISETSLHYNAHYSATLHLPVVHLPTSIKQSNWCLASALIFTVYTQHITRIPTSTTRIYIYTVFFITMFAHHHHPPSHYNSKWWCSWWCLFVACQSVCLPTVSLHNNGKFSSVQLASGKDFVFFLLLLLLLLLSSFVISTHSIYL